MKKSCAAFLVLLIFIFTMTGCNGGDKNGDDDPSSNVNDNQDESSGGNNGGENNGGGDTALLEYVLSEDGTYYCVKGTDKDTSEKIVIPETHEGLPVKEILDEAFAEFKKLPGITIPNGVTKIGKNAFFCCYNLTSIVIPESMTVIDQYAFKDCYRLVEVYNLSSLSISAGSSFSNGMAGFYALDVYNSPDEPSKLHTTQDGYLFYDDGEDLRQLVMYTGNESELILPESCNGKDYNIRKYAFFYNTNISSVVISNRTFIIYGYAFTGCENLQNVYYRGTESEWNEITIIEGNDALTKATRHYSF